MVDGVFDYLRVKKVLELSVDRKEFTKQTIEYPKSQYPAIQSISAGNIPAIQLISSGPGLGSGIVFRNIGAPHGKGYIIFTAPDGCLHFVDDDGPLPDRLVIHDDGTVGVGETVVNGDLHVKGKLDVQNQMQLNDNRIFLRGTGDDNHGIGFGGNFAGTSIDGPVLYGYEGGALGSHHDGERIALRWDRDGNIVLNDHRIFLRAPGDPNHGIGFGGSFAGNTVDGPVLYGYDGGALGSHHGDEKIALRWDCDGNLSLNNNRLFLRGPGDTNHGLGFGGNFGGHQIDGPVLYGYDGGALGSHQNGDKIALRWRVDGSIEVPGDILLTGADCAEEFEVEEADGIDPGTVLVIGDNGTLRQCREQYDRKVAGVVSGGNGTNPGIILNKGGSQESKLPIALSGKVYCKVDAEYDPIGTGDLLTTSSTAGHAMKASDPISAFGAVIGKALSPLEKGEGLIPIIVTLQ